MSNTPPKDSKRSTKEKAAAAREAAEAQQRRRDNRIRIFGGAAILIAVALIIGLAIRGSNSTAAPTTGVVADAAIPAGVNGADATNAWGVPYNTAAGKPTLAIWEDFGCPVCGQLEAKLGAGIVKLADDGKVNLVWRPTTFIEGNFPNSPNPSSSTRAVAAWGCAIDAGKTAEYHSIVFQNQPATEGDGWTDQQLIDFGTQAGITGDAAKTFSTCVTNGTYKQWATNSYTVFQDSAVPGTPALYLNGKEVPTSAYTDIATLEKYISSNA